MKRFLKTILALTLIISMMGQTTDAANVNLTTSQTYAASGAVSAKQAKFSGSNSSSSANSVRFYSQYKNSAGNYANDANVKVAIGGKCATTKTFQFSSSVKWRLYLKPNAWNAKNCTATGTITGV